MNFNASRNVAQSGGIRKAKRVSDVAAMGAPSPAPTFSPSPAYNPGYPAAPTPAAPYSESIQLDSQDFNTPGVAQNYGFMGGFPATPPQIGTMLQQPIVQDMALQYGNRLANEGKAVVTRELGRLVPVSRLRYYFAVDTRYVLRKLLLIAFPYTHKEWMVKYDQELPVQPRYDLNAPDLYIPSMGYVTYVLLAGFMLGLQHRFSPEQIGMQASSALAYIACEVALYMFTLYISGAGAGAGAGTLDLLAHSGYKYCVMIASLLAALLLGPTAYYCCLAFGSFSLSFFLVRTLRVQIMSAPPEQAPYGTYGAQPPYGASPQSPHSPYSPVGSKRRVYFLLFVGVTQPLLCWWLTRHLVPPTALAPLTPLAPEAPVAPVVPAV